MNSIKEIRKNQRMTQSVFAKYLGVSQALIAACEKDHRLPSIYMLYKLHTFFGVDINELLYTLNIPVKGDA